RLRHPSSALFPYTTLFRSRRSDALARRQQARQRYQVLPEQEGENHEVQDGEDLGERLQPRRSAGLLAAEGRPFVVLVTARSHAPDRKSTRLNSSHEWISYA